MLETVRYIFFYWISNIVVKVLLLCVCWVYYCGCYVLYCNITYLCGLVSTQAGQAAVSAQCAGSPDTVTMDTDITEYEDRLYSVCEVPGRHSVSFICPTHA